MFSRGWRCKMPIFAHLVVGVHDHSTRKGVCDWCKFFAGSCWTASGSLVFKPSEGVARGSSLEELCGTTSESESLRQNGTLLPGKMRHATHKTFIMAVRMVTGKCWGFNFKPGQISEVVKLTRGISVSNLIGFNVWEIPVAIHSCLARNPFWEGLCVNVKYEWPYFGHVCICNLHRTLMHLKIKVVTEVCVFVVSKVK